MVRGIWLGPRYGKRRDVTTDIHRCKYLRESRLFFYRYFPVCVRENHESRVWIHRYSKQNTRRMRHALLITYRPRTRTPGTNNFQEKSYSRGTVKKQRNKQSNVFLTNFVIVPTNSRRRPLVAILAKICFFSLFLSEIFQRCKPSSSVSLIDRKIR